MPSTFYSGQYMKTTTDNGNDQASTPSMEQARRNLVALAKLLDEAEAFLSASSCYAGASSTRFESVKNLLSFVEADIRSASDGIIETERKLQTIRQELQSLYQNIFRNEASDGGQYRGSERNANNVQAPIVMPQVLGLVRRYAAEASTVVKEYTGKCQERRGSTLDRHLHPKDSEPESQRNQERDTEGDWIPRQRRMLENYAGSRHSTANIDNGNCISFKDSRSSNQGYEEPGHQWEVPRHRNPDFWVDTSLEDYDTNSKLTRAPCEIDHVDGSDFPVNRRQASRANGGIPENSTANAASRRSWHFEGRHSSSKARLPEKPKLPRTDSYSEMCSNVDDTSQDSKREYENANMCETVKLEIGGTRSQTPSRDSFHARRHEAGGEIQNDYARNVARSDETLHNIHTFKPNKKAGICPLSLRHSRQTGRRNYQSSNSEERSDRCGEFFLRGVATLSTEKGYKSAVGGYIKNPIRAFQTDRKFKKMPEDESADESGSSISSSASLSEEMIPKFLWQDSESVQTQKERPDEPRFFQTESTKAKYCRKNPMALIDKPTRKCFLPGRNDLNDIENNPKDISSRISSAVPLESTKQNDGMDNRNFKTSSSRMVSSKPFENTVLLDPNGEFASSVNRSVTCTDVSTSCNIAMPLLCKEKPYSSSQKKIRSSQPVTVRGISATFNSAGDLVSSEHNQPRNANTCRFHQDMPNSTFQAATKASNSDNCSEPRYPKRKKSFDPNDDEDTPVVEDEFQISCSTSDISRIAKSELESEDVNYGNISFETTDSQLSRTVLPYFISYSPLVNSSSSPSNEKSSTCELAGPSLRHFVSQNETTRLLSENSSAITSSFTSTGWSHENNFEEPRESCFDLSSPGFPFASLIRRSSSTSFPDPGNGSPESPL